MSLDDLDDLVRRLALAPHPEGGWYRETYRAATVVESARGPRSASTAILYLLPGGVRSRWHRVASDELWHLYDGAPLRLHLRDGGRLLSTREPQALVPAGAWQAAESTGDWSLCGCTVAPGFDFSDFELE
jgi:predicted cupin superfamily sugar epimerase